MPWIVFRTSLRPCVSTCAAAVVLLALLITFLFPAYVAAAADQPFKIESESGEVIDFQGNVHDEESGVNQYGVQPILPLPVKQKPSAEIKRAPPEPVKKPEQGDMPSHEFKRAKPSIIKKTAADKTEKKAPDADAAKKPEKATGADTEKDVAPPSPVKAGPDEGAGDEVKTSLPIPGENEKAATAKEIQAPSPPLPLMKGVSFSLSSEGIEYNWRTKTLRAKSGFYSQNGIAIIADEIRIDLHKGLLAASGHVTLYFDATMAMKGHNYIGHLLLYNMQTMEAAVETDSGTSYLSPVETASVSGLADDSFMGAVTLYPSATAPSLAGAGIVEYSGGGEDVIKARKLSFSSTEGITFTGADYSNNGKSYSLPTFHTRSGELTQRTFNTGFLASYLSPSDKNIRTDGGFSYYVNDAPQRMTVLSGTESLSLSHSKTDFKNTYSHELTRLMVFGNNTLSVGLATKKNSSSSVSADYKRYWFADKKTDILFRYSYSKTSTPAIRGKQSDLAFDQASVSISRNTGRYAVSVSSSSSKQNEQIEYATNSGFYYSILNSPDSTRLSINTNRFTLYGKPGRIMGRRLFLYGFYDYYGSASKLKETFSKDNWKFSIREDINAKDKFRSNDIKVGITSGQFRIASRTFGMARIEYESYSYLYAFEMDRFTYSYRDYVKTDEARGIAGLEWKFSGKGVAGADYVWNRKSRKGYSVITPYLSYAGSTRWNVRLSGRYHEEMVAGKDVFAGKRLMGEMFDISTKLSKNSTLQASWDLDNMIHGVTLYSLDLKSDSRKGLTVFSVSKYTTSSTAYSYWGPILITTITDSTPYRYSLSYYPK